MVKLDPFYTAQHPIMLDFTATPLGEPKMSKHCYRD